MKILQIVAKNTSTLDYSLPIFWALNNRNIKSDVTVLYCVGDKRRVLRRSTFFSKELRNIGAKELDYIDLLNFRSIFLESFLRRICQQSLSDQSSFYGLRFNCCTISLFLKTIIPFFQKKLLHVLECWLAQRLCFDDFFKRNAPDLIILDNREDSRFAGAKSLFDVVFASSIPKIVMPHAPHFNNPGYVFSPVNPYGKDFYPECEAWVPFKFSNTEQNHPSLTKHFYYVGYPGFDDEWIEHCKSYPKSKSKKIVCLYIGRKFLDRNVKKPDDLDYVIMDYNSVFADLLSIKESFVRLGQKMTLIFKPHPSSNYKLVKKILDEVSFDEYKITHEPLFGQEAELDFVFSSYSTSTLIPVLAGIPTIVFNSKVQKRVNEEWCKVAEMYIGLSYFIEPSELFETIESLIGGNSTQVRDKAHLREFFPDGAIDRSLDRLIALSNENRCYLDKK